MGDSRARLTLLSFSLPLLAVVSLAVGCGDNVPSSQTGTGGSSVTGTGGSGGGTGGMSTGGAGGMSTGGAGGMSTGGAGGVGTGGAGGLGTGGAGGVSTGGTGGVGTGGTGGVGTGGTGGVGTGGAGGGPPACYTTAFTAPASGATLTVTDDGNHTCADGFQYTVTITSGAPDGTDVTLYDGSTLLKTVKVSGGAASFAVQLSTAGAQQLSIQYPSTQTCNVSENVTVSCPNSPPTCTISKPVISATHPELNGVPTAQNGDRSSSAGSPYQATFVVNTNAEDGQAVTLAVNSEATNPPTAVDGTPTANVSGGSATFGLTLVPDGTYDVTATCVNKNGITGTSTKSTFTVDTTPPDLTVTSPSAGMFVVGGTVRACAETDSSDAASLAGSLGAGQRNLCVTLGSSATPTCVAVAAINTPTCVNFICPGSSAFSLTYTLSDAAGNPMTQTVTGVTCASALPSVQIVAPVSDAPSFTDKSKHILAANAPIGVKDEDPNTIGAQADVVACTDTVGTATLFVGHQGDSSLVQLGTALTTVAATGQCPSGLGNVAVFAGVTLPESNEKADGTLLAATELQVSVTSATNSADTGTSLVDDVWVDSQVPNLALLAP
ncbi:MAG TPA: hypothetical protein VN853_18110, partial [Polyangia bacterium]|nr:hypothetical protein [Polyangia bacterium]